MRYLDLEPIVDIFYEDSVDKSVQLVEGSLRGSVHVVDSGKGISTFPKKT